MTLILNILFAWIAIISGILLSIIWLIRIIQLKMNKCPQKDQLIKINKTLRKNHINLGYIFLLSSLIHGMLSSFSILSINYGTITFVIGCIIWHTFVDKSNLGKIWIKYHRQLTIILVITTIIHIVEVGGFMGIENILTNFNNGTRTELQINSKEKLEYEDGIYEGIGDGYRAGLKVEVTIKEGKIYGINIIEHNEVGSRFYTPAFAMIPTKIIEEQTTNVDIVTGATRSSNGIIQAVENALSQAAK
ncbi:MAG: FMN-binding protein [Peptostreptococcaceae bacterium]